MFLIEWLLLAKFVSYHIKEYLHTTIIRICGLQAAFKMSKSLTINDLPL